MANLDSLTDAAAVLSIDMDSNAEEHQCQEAAAGEPSGDMQGPGVLESLAAGMV